MVIKYGDIVEIIGPDITGGCNIQGQGARGVVQPRHDDWARGAWSFPVTVQDKHGGSHTWVFPISSLKNCYGRDGTWAMLEAGPVRDLRINGRYVGNKTGRITDCHPCLVIENGVTVYWNELILLGESQTICSEGEDGVKSVRLRTTGAILAR